MVKITKWKPPIWLVSTIILLFLMTFFIISCKSNNNISKDSSNTNANLLKKTIELPNDLFLKGVSENKIISVKSNSKNIYKYDYEKQELNKETSANNPNNFIHTVICNDEWIIWEEDEGFITEGYKPFQWQIIGRNISSNEEIIIDKSILKNNKYDVPLFINFYPSKLSISENNVLAYCKSNTDDNKNIYTELIIYDLKTNNKKSISKTSSVWNELIQDCTIYNDQIVWSKFYNLNDDYNKRLTQYLYSDLFLFNSKTNIYQQLTSNEYYFDPYLYKDKLVAVRIPLKKPSQNACNSEIILMNINDKKISTIVDENSACYTKIENELYRSSPKVNKQYICWYNNGFSNRYVYDYINSKFIEIYDAKSDNADNIVNINNMFDNYIFLNINNVQSVNNKNILVVM